MRLSDACAVLLSAVTVAVSAGLLDRDPCERWEDKPGACRETETAGDRWSRDHARGAAQASVPRNVAEEILEQVQFPPAMGVLPEVDTLGNIIIPVQADALVTHDGDPDTGPMIAGMDIRGSRCARSVEGAIRRSGGGAFTVVCLPREYGLYHRMMGEQVPNEEQVEPDE